MNISWYEPIRNAARRLVVLRWLTNISQPVKFCTNCDHSSLNIMCYHENQGAWASIFIICANGNIYMSSSHIYIIQVKYQWTRSFQIGDAPCRCVYTQCKIMMIHVLKWSSWRIQLVASALSLYFKLKCLVISHKIEHLMIKSG